MTLNCWNRRCPPPLSVNFNHRGMRDVHLGARNNHRFNAANGLHFSFPPRFAVEADESMMKVKQKVSGGFRTDEGAKEFAVIRTMIATARKKGWNIITSLLQDTQSLIKGLSSA